MKRMRCVAIGLALAACLPAAAAPATYAETVAECVALFAPLVPVARAQALVPKHALGAAPEVTGNGETCTVDFKEKDWARDKPGSATPLLMFSVSHGGDQRASFDGQARMARGMAKDAYAEVAASDYPGVEKAFSYTLFGRHWLLLLRRNVVVTVQVRADYPSSTLARFAPLVLAGIDAPAFKDWRERR